jgi:hypothetical protein
MAKSKIIKLRVDFHPSGSYTLKARQGEKGAFSDLEEDALFNNDDKGEFYRAALREFARLAAEGNQVTYSDTEADDV